MVKTLKENNFKKTDSNKKNNKEKKDKKIDIEDNKTEAQEGINKIEQTLDLKFIGFSSKILHIHEAGKYEIELNNKISKSLFYQILSGLNNKYVKKMDEDILLNGISIKKDKIVSKFIQKNAVFLKKNTFLYEDLTLRKNLKIISLMYKGFDLSNATIHSFMFQDIADKKVQELTQKEKQLAILSYVVCCPALIWVIDNELLENLDEKQQFLFENAVKIRIKQGGIILVLK